MTMERRTVVTGIGVVSSLGRGREAFWQGLMNGISGIGEVTAFDTSYQRTHRGGQIKDFMPEMLTENTRVLSLNRSSQLALVAAELALADADLKEISRPARGGVSLGTTLGDMQTIEEIDDRLVINSPVPGDIFRKVMTHNAPAIIAAALGLEGPLFMFSTACAAGNYALAYGYDLIKLGKAEVIVAGASDPMSRIEYTGFNQFGAVAPDISRPFDKNRKGMMLAEGSGIVVLEFLDHALARGAAIYAEVIGYGLSCDAKHMTNPSVEGVAECMKKAMSEAGVGIGDIDYISAHGTGTQANDRTECAAFREVFGEKFRKIPVSSIKSMLGHTMGAASALEAIACVLSVRNDMIPPTINYETPDPECDIDCVPNKARNHVVNVAMNNSYAFGGNNASVVFRKFNI